MKTPEPLRQVRAATDDIGVVAVLSSQTLSSCCCCCCYQFKFVPPPSLLVPCCRRCCYWLVFSSVANLSFLRRHHCLYRLDGDFAAGFSLRAFVNLEVGSLAETRHMTFKLQWSLVRRRLEGCDNIALLTIDSNGLVAVLHSLFCIAVRMRMVRKTSGMCRESPPPEGLPTLAKLLPL